MNNDWNGFDRTGERDGTRHGVMEQGRGFGGLGRRHGHGGPGTMPRGFGPGMDGGPHGMPREFGGLDGMDGLRCMPRGFGGPGRPGGPGGFGPGGMPPRRPDPDFLRKRIEDGDLMELIDMAGRMAHRRPQGGPARGQALVLSILAGREALSQRELQQMLGIQPGSLSELLSKLEAKGFLTREKGEDRRGNLLRITDAGRAAIPQAEETEDDPFAPLTAEEQDRLAGLLRTLLTRWMDELEPPRGRRMAPGGDRPVEV